MGWLIALAALAGFAVLPVGVRAVYDSGGGKAWFLLGRIPVMVYPRRRKDKSGKKNEKKKTAGQGTQKQSGGSAADFVPIARSLLKLLSDLRRRFRVRLLRLHIRLAGEDPADLALNYGKATAALEGLMPQLERFFVIQSRDIRLHSDFTAEKTLVYARLDLTITVGRLLILAARHGFVLVRDFLNILKLRKGGANP